jgi:hypothetical protein
MVASGNLHCVKPVVVAMLPAFLAVATDQAHGLCPLSLRPERTKM